MGKDYPITVDYSKSLDEMIKAGHYDWVNFDITSKHFPINLSGKHELVPELIHYGKAKSSDAVIRDLDQRGLRPATVAELLAFGEAYPDKRREFPIVALGSVWQNWCGYCLIVYLGGDGSRRELVLIDWGVGWDGRYRFLAIPK